jgi:hypothetical protein
VDPRIGLDEVERNLASTCTGITIPRPSSMQLYLLPYLGPHSLSVLYAKCVKLPGHACSSMYFISEIHYSVSLKRDIWETKQTLMHEFNHGMYHSVTDESLNETKIELNQISQNKAFLQI